MDRKQRLEIMACLRAQAKDAERRGDVVARGQCARQYRELATAAEWARRPAYLQEQTYVRGAAR